MTDIDLPLASIAALVPSVSLSLPIPPTPSAPGVPTDYNVYACTHNGSLDTRTAMVTAKVTRVTWALNAPTTAEFTVDFDDPQIEQLPLSIVPFAADDDHNHEVQIYRNGQLIFWGPLVARQGDNEGRVFSYIAKDPLWYLTARFFGEANRHNFLTNGDFESDSPGDFPTVGWNVSGGSGTIEITADNFLTGQQAVHLQGSSFDLYLGQILTVTAGAIGLAVIVTAWVFVNHTSTTFINSSHIALKRIQPFTATVLQESDVTLGQQVPARQWVRVSTALLLPPSSTSLVEVDLFAAGDDIYVDAVTLTIEESLSLIPANSGDGLPWDQIDIAKMITRYAGGAYPIGDPYTKSNIRLGTAGDPSGVRKVRTYQFFDHQAVYQGGVGAGGLDEFVQASDGFDMRVELSPSNRTLHFYYPAVGQTWDADLFRYVREVSLEGVITGESIRLLKYSWPESIEGAANNVTVIGGWGNGAGREEGGANLDVFGELTLEHIEAAPTGATIDLLGGIAEARAEQLGQAQVTPVLTIAERRDPITGVVDIPIIGALLPGDLMPVVIVDGPIQLDQTVRATQVVLTPDTETLAVSVQLNVPEGLHAPVIPQRSRSYLERRHHQRLYELERRILHVQGLTQGED